MNSYEWLVEKINEEIKAHDKNGEIFNGEANPYQEQLLLTLNFLTNEEKSHLLVLIKPSRLRVEIFDLFVKDGTLRQINKR